MPNFDPKRKYRLKRTKNQPTVGTSIPHSENQVQLSNIVDDVSYFPKDKFPSDNFPSGNIPNVQFLQRQLSNG